MPIPGMPCSVAGSPRDRWPVASHDGQRVQSPARQVISPGPQVQPARQMACPGPQIESPARQTASPGPQDQSARQMACPGPQIQSPARQVMTPRPQIQSPAQQMPTQQIMPPRPQDQSAQQVVPPPVPGTVPSTADGMPSAPDPASQSRDHSPPSSRSSYPHHGTHRRSTYVPAAGY